MSTHFTYEIDERKLRVKLKDVETSYSEEAWQRFAEYSGANSKNNSHSRFQNIRMPLNRNVIVPAVFGLLIIIFSFLLFNFINIKNPARQGAEANPQININTMQVKENTNPVVPVVPSEKVPAPTNNAEAVKAPETVVKTAATQAQKRLPPSGTPPVQAVVSTPSVSLQRATAQVASPVAQNTSTTGTVATSTAITQNAADSGMQKKRKKRSVEVVDTDSSTDSRPNLGAEERETEARPN